MLSEDVIKGILCLYIVFNVEENYLIEIKSISDNCGSKLHPQEDFTIDDVSHWGVVDWEGGNEALRVAFR